MPWRAAAIAHAAAVTDVPAGNETAAPIKPQPSPGDGKADTAPEKATDQPGKPGVDASKGDDADNPDKADDTGKPGKGDDTGGVDQ